MHPDEAVDLAMQDLRALEAAQPSPRPAPLLSGALRSLWGRYLEGWTWYVQEGRTPPAEAEVGHLPRRGIVPAPAPRLPLAAAGDCPPLVVAGTAGR